MRVGFGLIILVLKLMCFESPKITFEVTKGWLSKQWVFALVVVIHPRHGLIPTSNDLKNFMQAKTIHRNGY